MAAEYVVRLRVDYATDRPYPDADELEWILESAMEDRQGYWTATVLEVDEV